MNEFLQQFLLESREHVQQATDGLLLLEKSPYDAERLDEVFRAFHTLKGGAGIVEFAAMERAVHAAEDVLTAARTGKQALATKDVGDCLACLDQVVQWLDVLEQSHELPTNVDAQAESVIRRFAARNRREPAAAPAKDWIEPLLGSAPDFRARAKTAIRLVPDADCFFRGEDPLARISSLDLLLACAFEPKNAWPSLANLDPFECNLTLTALTASSGEEVRSHMAGHSGQCEIRAVTPDDASGTSGDGSGSASGDASAALPQRVRDVLTEQLALLDEGKAPNLAGRIASAGVTAANVLRFCGQNSHSDSVALATDSSLAAGSPQTLSDAIAQALASRAPVRQQQPDAHADIVSKTLRVDAARIDALVRLTGELTVAKNAVGHVVKLAQADNSSFAGVLKDRHGVLEHLIGELQRSVLAMRVLPLRTVFQRFPRVLRDISASLGKSAQLKIVGEDTEADKAIVEMLFEPLVHVVRNALDHGVESPDSRRGRGKPPMATIEIRAVRQADQVVIEVSDDGAGIDVGRVREVAKNRGVATPEELRAMSEAEVIDLVFAAGFSTAEKVTELSGRGVGMDAVRTAVERVGGRVSIESQAGRGTTVKFLLPFSVMMTHVMTVEAGGQMFGVPLDSIIETVRVPTESIAGIGAAHAVVLRDRTLPVFELANVLGVSQAMDDRTDAILVIAAAAGQFGGLRVDRIGERMEVILKPLEGLLSGTPGIAGTTLLGDGRILLVLDIAEMLQ